MVDPDPQLTPSQASLIDGARSRGLEVISFGWGGMMVLAGRGRRIRLMGTVTHRTSHLAVRLAGDKHAVKTLLARRGLPVCPGELVQTAEAAAEVALRLAAPVAVKPNLGKQGEAVRTGLTEPGVIRAAFERAAAYGGDVIVETAHVGRDLRLLVVDGRVAAVAERRAPFVIGDGIRTISLLLDALNADPRRGRGHMQPLTRVEADEELHELLTQQGLAFSEAPTLGRAVRLRYGAGLSRGGAAIDRTDEVHPELCALAVQAANLVGLDVAGVDLMVNQIDQPLRAAGAAILEVNASPGLRMHLSPNEGVKRDVAGAILEYLFA